MGGDDVVFHHRHQYQRRRRQIIIMKLLLVILFSISSMPAAGAWLIHPQHPTSKTTTPSSSTAAFVPTKKILSSSISSSTTRLYSDNNNDNESNSQKGPFDFLNPYESKIPAELKDEIYRAEANTPAAKERGQRVALYALIAFVGILCAFFNGFLSELRAGGLPSVEDAATGITVVSGDVLADAGFGWVQDNFFLSFLFLNKIGGGVLLLGGAGAGLLAEAELDTKRINAEKIYEELVRRKEAKTKKANKKAGKKRPSSNAGSRKKGRMSGKALKRMEALSEVVGTDDTSVAAATPAAEDPPAAPEEDVQPQKEESTKNEGGVFGKMKDLYEKADAMAASQALLMNKQLEDAGVVDKITDESGLKVIGREEAAKLQEKKKEEEKKE